MDTFVETRQAEAQAILGLFRKEKMAEYKASGKAPSACIAGIDSFHCLKAAIEITTPNFFYFSGAFEFAGVTVHPSMSINNGFYFGHKELWPL